MYTCLPKASKFGKRRAAPPVASNNLSYATTSPFRSSTVFASALIFATPFPRIVSTPKSANLSSDKISILVSSGFRITSFDSGGRSYGRCVSSPINVILPSYLLPRSSKIALAPAWPAPTITMLFTLLILLTF